MTNHVGEATPIFILVSSLRLSSRLPSASQYFLFASRRGLTSCRFVRHSTGLLLSAAQSLSTSWLNANSFSVFLPCVTSLQRRERAQLRRLRLLFLTNLQRSICPLLSSICCVVWTELPPAGILNKVVLPWIIKWNYFCCVDITQANDIIIKTPFCPVTRPWMFPTPDESPRAALPSSSVPLPPWPLQHINIYQHKQVL